MNKYFVCLANSYKRGGRCVAGIEIAFDANGNWTIARNNDGTPHWLRPIDTETEYGEIPNHVALNIKHFSVVRLIDVVACPEDAHVENVHFSRIEVCQNGFPSDIETLEQFIDHVHQSIFHNRGKAISAQMLTGINYSLMFIHVQNASAYIDDNREKSKNRMCFTYYGSEYDLPITDPTFLEELKKAPKRFATIPTVYLTLSLGLEFEGWHHKLVAGVTIPSVPLQTNNIEGISYMEQQKQVYANAYAKWTPEDDERLRKLYTEEGITIEELTRILGRNEGAIRSRIKKLGLDEIIPSPPTFHEGINGLGGSQQEPSNWFDEYENVLAQLLDQKEKIEEQINDLRQKILKQMENHGVDKVHSHQFSVSYTPSKTIMQFDSRAFREAHEELYSSFCMPKQREACIVVKRNKED